MFVVPLKSLNTLYPKARTIRFLVNSQRSLSTFIPSTRKKPQTLDIPAERCTFEEKAKEQIIKLTRGMENMKRFNEKFQITSTQDELIVDVGEKGKFMFTIDYEVNRINLISPISGVFQYEYDDETSEWLNANDRHDIRGMVTRDLLRHWGGLPDF